MWPSPAGREASSGVDALPYVRHRPERTLLYQLVEEYYPALTAHLSAQGTDLPGYVQQQFEEYLRCGRLEHGFLRMRCDSCHAEHLVAFSWPLLRIPAPAALVNPFTSQEARFLPQLRHPTHGRECRAAGRRGLSRAAGAPMGRPLSVAFPVRQPPRGHGSCARQRLPLHRHAPDPEGGVLA
jgi:hypothetical protein